MGTNGAAKLERDEGVTERITSRRARRDSFHGIRITWRGLGAVLGLLSFLGVVGVGLWGAATAFGGKADDEDLDGLRERHQSDFHRLDKKVDRIYLEQRAFIQHAAPELEVDKKADELKPFPEGEQ